MRAKTVELSLKYEFTTPEMLQLGRMLADERMKLQEIEDRKKAVMADFKAQLENSEQELYRLAGLVRAGCEYRPTKCAIDYNDPDTGTKSYYRLDDHELIRQEAMSPEECQEELPIRISEQVGEIESMYGDGPPPPQPENGDAATE